MRRFISVKIADGFCTAKILHNNTCESRKYVLWYFYQILRHAVCDAQTVLSSRDGSSGHYSQRSKGKRRGRDAFEGVLMDRLFAKMHLARRIN